MTKREAEAIARKAFWNDAPSADYYTDWLRLQLSYELEGQRHLANGFTLEQAIAILTPALLNGTLMPAPET